MVSPAKAGRQRPSPMVKLIVWSLMASAIMWTLVYKAGKSDPKVPEFVYVNF